MERYIAFLRAINVGGHNVKMEYLRTIFEALGFANVATFIASGNVIFESLAGNARALEEQIEQHLKEALGYEVATFIRTSSELEAIANYQAFPAADLVTEGSSLYVGFLHASPGDTARQKLLALHTPTDEFAIQGREFYWSCRTRMSESPVFGISLEKVIGMPATMRNITTVRKLAAKYSSPAMSKRDLPA